MAVLVSFTLPRATPTELATAEQRAQERGATVGGPPYPGLMFFALTRIDDGYRSVSACRTEQDFHATHGAKLGPDLASAGLTVVDAITPIVSMALPAHTLADAHTSPVPEVVAAAFVRLARFPGAREQHFRVLAAAMGELPAREGRLVFAAGGSRTDGKSSRSGLICRALLSRGRVRRRHGWVS